MIGAWEAWGVAGLLLAAAELLAPGYFLLPIGLAALAAAAVAAAAPPWQMQACIFAAAAALLCAGASRVLRRRPRPDTVNGPAAGLVGAQCTAIAFHAGEGRVQLRDGTWQARLQSGTTVPPGTPLRITALEGTTLRVTP